MTYNIWASARWPEREESLKHFLQFHQPDILCLQEIKIQKHQIYAVEAPRPKWYTRFCYIAEKKGYSGVATYSRDNITQHDKKWKLGMSVRRFDGEGRFVSTNNKDGLLYDI